MVVLPPSRLSWVIGWCDGSSLHTLVPSSRGERQYSGGLHVASCRVCITVTSPSLISAIQDVFLCAGVNEIPLTNCTLMKGCVGCGLNAIPYLRR